MTSTSALTCTRFVPETITSGSAAGQSVGVWYKSRLEMNRTSGNAEQGIRTGIPCDQRVLVSPGIPMYPRVSAWLVPVLYPTMIAAVQRNDRAGAR